MIKRSCFLFLFWFLFYPGSMIADAGRPMEQVRNINSLGFQVFDQLLKEEHVNILISPLSLYYATLMAYAAADGVTRDEISSVLGLEGQSVEASLGEYGLLLQAILKTANSESVELEVRNSIQAARGMDIPEWYVRVMEKKLYASVHAKGMNEAEQGEGKPRSEMDSVSRFGVFSVLNKIQFSGQWLNLFEEEKTAIRKFWLTPKQSINVNMMEMDPTGKAGFEYTNHNKFFQILELPYYLNSHLGMVVFLPKASEKGFAELSQFGKELYNEGVEKLMKKDVEIYFPRFSFAFRCALTEGFRQLGIKKAFDPNHAKIFGRGGGEALSLYINEVAHSCKIAVDEKGTTAAAATEILWACIAQSPPVFRADHPFVFAIRDKKTGVILFLGKMGNPTEQGNVN